jgi:hypothetical protein
MECKDGSSPEAVQHSSDDKYIPEERTWEPKRFYQQELNDLIQDLSLSKDKADLLASTLKERNPSESDVRASHYRIWNNVLKTFRADGSMVFCHNINGLFKGLKQEHNLSDWRLFFDSSQRSLKAVLRKGNSKPYIPTAHSIHLKETYDNMRILLEAMQYNVHQRNICEDLKVTGKLTGMKGGFTQFCCFLRLWDSRSTAEHYIKRDWEPQKT